MASLTWSSYLRTLFGADTSGIDREAIQRLIVDAIPEHSALDYKREPYPATDDKRREIAADVAAFANAAGGMILVGVEENDDSTAARIVPVSATLRDTEERRIREVVASRVFPIPRVEVEWITVDGGGVICIAVPPSPAAPHAVPRSGSPKDPFLCWPHRDGTGKRYLTEPEVADAYSRRARRERGSLERVVDAAASLTRVLATDDDRRWLTAVLVPGIPGAVHIADWDAQRVDREVVKPAFALPPEQRFLESYGVEYAPALRRLRISDALGLPTAWWIAELHADGTASFADPVSTLTGEWNRQNPALRGPAPTTTILPESWVFLSLCRVLAGVVHLAARVGEGSGGDSLLRLTLNARGAETGSYRNHDRWFADHVADEDLELTITMDLSRASEPDGFRLLLGMVAGDVWNGLGFRTCGYIGREGQLSASASALLRT